MSQNDNSNLVSPEQAEQLQSTLDQTVEDLGLPGATASVITPSGTWFSAGGVSNLETQEKMQPDDIYGIGSITKTFTAATVLKTVESGKFTLDDTLGQWLPEIAARIPDGESITIRQLLNGTSGIYDFVEDPQYLQDVTTDFQAGSTKEWKPEDIVAYIYDKPRFEGERSTSQWNYPNTGNVLAGMILAKATGKEFKDVLQEQVLDPLGLKNTFYGKEGLNSIDRDQLASGYQDLFTADGQLGQDGISDDLTNFNPDVYQSSGAIFSNTQDLVRFFQSLSGGELLKSESLQEMLNFVEVGEGFGYGLGVLSQETTFGNSIGFSGETEAYGSNFSHFTELDTTLVTGVNAQLNYEDPLKDASIDPILQSSLLEASGVFSQFSIQGTNNDDNLTVNSENDSLAGLEGLEGNDTLTGGDNVDVLNGGMGNDSLLGEGSIDYLFGKAGNDFLDGGEDSDRLNGGLDNDTLIGSSGDDILLGSEGKDSLDGGEGDDFLDGGAGNDIVKDEQGNNSLYGNEGNDLIFAGMGDDLLYGGAGNDSLSGGGKSDRLIGDAGNDTLDAGEGNDTLFGGDGDDLLIGGLGKDTLTGNEGKDLFTLQPGAMTTITDFTDGQDLLQLPEGLSFADLKITQGSGENAADTLITLNNNSEIIAVLNGVSAELVATQNFVTCSENRQ
jgi:CubicO group peptidase (beta-lactamase class C family)